MEQRWLSAALDTHAFCSISFFFTPYSKLNAMRSIVFFLLIVESVVSFAEDDNIKIPAHIRAAYTVADISLGMSVGEAKSTLEANGYDCRTDLGWGTLNCKSSERIMLGRREAPVSVVAIGLGHTDFSKTSPMQVHDESSVVIEIEFEQYFANPPAVRLMEEELEARYGALERNRRGSLIGTASAPSDFDKIRNEAREQSSECTMLGNETRRRPNWKESRSSLPSFDCKIENHSTAMTVQLSTPPRIAIQYPAGRDRNKIEITTKWEGYGRAVSSYGQKLYAEGQRASFLSNLEKKEQADMSEAKF